MSTPRSEPRLFNARPTFRVDGREQALLSSGLLELSIVETTQGLYRCELKVGNWGAVEGEAGFLYFDRQLLDFGKELEVRLGQDVLFAGRLSALEAHFPEGSPPELTVLAEDRLLDLRMVRRTATHTDVSDSDVIRHIAAQYGLSANVDLSGPTHKVLAQVNQSDLAFLRERCRSLDAELWMEGRTLHVRSHGRRVGASPIELGWGNELREFTVLADLAGQCTSVVVSGWDTQNKSMLRAEAGDAVLAGELGPHESGASLLASTLGERKQSVVHTVPLSSGEAQARAESYFRQGARRFVTGRGVAEPDARLRVGGSVQLQGLGGLFSGAYYLTEVKHLFDGFTGMRTEFLGERAGLGRTR
jgi:phage protein D